VLKIKITTKKEEKLQEEKKVKTLMMQIMNMR
jgi:hypothetical protein